MPALGSPAIWRTHPYSYKGYLFIHQPDIVFQARVNQASFSYPLAQVTFDTVTTGAYTDIRPGMTILFGSGAGLDDRGRQRIRKAPTSTIIYIGESSRGNKDGEANLADNAYITVLDDFRVWAKIPRQLDDGTMYKDYDIALGSFGTQMPPVANGGIGIADFISGVILTVNFSAVNSFAVSGATPLTYLWEIGDGTITVGTSASQDITATFPAGFRWVHLTVTDANAKTHTCHIPVFAAETTGVNSPIMAFEVNDQLLTTNGQRLKLKVLADIPRDTYPDGSLVMYWEKEVYGSNIGSLAGQTGRQHMKFIGWMFNENESSIGSEKGLVRNSIIECVDVANKLATLPGFPQILEHAAVPSNWAEMQSPNIDKYIHYVLHWHSTALDLTDFSWSGLGSTYPFTSLSSDGQNLWDQASQRAEAIAHKLTCDHQGILRVEPDPILQDTGDRTAISLVTLTEADFTSFELDHQRPPKFHWLRSGAVIASSTEVQAVLGVSPGQAPGQGEIMQSLNQQLVVDQVELNARAGHLYARINAEDNNFMLRLLHVGDGGIEPAFMEWLTLTLGANYASQRGLTYTSQRFLITETRISHRHTPDGRAKQVTLRLEKEAEGFPSATVIVPPPETPSFTPGYLTFPQLTFDLIDGDAPLRLFKGTKNIAAFNTDNYVYITHDFDTPPEAGGPTWTRVSLATAGMSGNLQRFVVDPFSPLYLQTGTTVNGWIVTHTGIYRVTDIFGTIACTLQYTFTDGPPGGGSSPRVQFSDIFASWGQQNWVVCTWYRSGANPGVRITYTTDGVNWSAEQTITAHKQNTMGGCPGLFVSSRNPGTAYVSAMTSSPGTGPAPAEVYKTTNYGANWAAITTPNIDLFFLAMQIEVPWDNNANQLITYYTDVKANAGELTTDYQRLYRIEADGTTFTIVTPANAGKDYVPRDGHWSLYAAPENRLNLICRGMWQDSPASVTLSYGVFVSKDGGTTWSLISGPDSDPPVSYAFGAISGNDENVLYLWGHYGKIAYSENLGTIIQNKMGNLLTDFPTIDKFEAICGS